MPFFKILQGKIMKEIKQTAHINGGGGGATPNPRKLMKKLKKSYYKAFFTLIKAYKRYYLGAWLFKIPFYKLTSNAIKLQKWQEKRKQRCEFLQESLKKFKDSKVLCKEFNKQSELWLNSKEFKEKYLDTKHPYPPLLNPDTLNDENSPLNYSNIPAEMAWELNLPLPQNYDFMYISNGSSASAATFRFLQKCNVNFADLYNGSKEIYLWYYDAFKKVGKNAFFAYVTFIPHINNTNNEAKKLANCLSKKVPLFYIARDPIEKLQHLINHLDRDKVNDNITPLMCRFNLSCDYTKLFPKLHYIGTYNPSLTPLSDLPFLYEKIVLDSALSNLKDKISKIVCIEFNEMKFDKAFDTFCKIADTLGFERPKNKEIFTNRINRNRGALIALPTTLYVHNDDLKNVFNGKNERQNLDSLSKSGGFSIIITLPHYLDETQKEFADITDEIEPNLVIDDTKILIIIDKDELAKLKENAPLFEAAKGYLKGYINTLKENALQIKNSLISEEQILEHLRENRDLRLKIKEILDNELNYIKQNHPEFIQKWKYYLEFEKMCAELDGTQNKGEK